MRFLSFSTLLVAFASLQAHAEAPIFRFTLDGADASLESHCTKEKTCFPIVVSLKENGRIVRSREFSSLAKEQFVYPSYMETDAVVSYLDSREQPDTPDITVEGLILGPALRSGIVSRDGLLEPKRRDGLVPGAVEMILARYEKIIALLETGVTAKRPVFQKLVWAVWPDSGYAPTSSTEDFKAVKGPIRIEGRGISDGQDRALYLACMASVEGSGCAEYRFILERSSGFERAYLGSAFRTRSPENFGRILEDRTHSRILYESFQCARLLTGRSSRHVLGVRYRPKRKEQAAYLHRMARNVDESLD